MSERDRTALLDNFMFYAVIGAIMVGVFSTAFGLIYLALTIAGVG